MQGSGMSPGEAAKRVIEIAEQIPAPTLAASRGDSPLRP
jgi:hypothetical protein